MFYVAICDDNCQVCSEIESILLKYKKRTGLQIETAIFYDGKSLLSYIEQGNTFDLIYLDIEMEQVNGLEVGFRLRKKMKNYATEIVYISGKEGYDRQLFEYQPLHFITKPFTEKVIIDDLELAFLRSKHNKVFFEYQKRHDVYRIPVNEILYFESFNREIRMVTDKGTESFYSTLEEVAERLKDSRFIRIHRSYLINYDRVHILRYTEVVMSNEQVLPIGKSRRQEFRKFQIGREGR